MRVPPLPAGSEAERSRIALCRGESTVDYGTLSDRVDALEAALSRTPGGTVVGIRIGNEPAFVIAYLACLAAKRTAVLLDSRWTASELRDAASRMDVSLLLETPSTPARGEAAAILGAESRELDPSGEVVGPWPDVRGESGRGPRRGGVVYWSSGSTGRPKAISVSEAALASRLSGLAERLALRPSDRALCILPLSHCHGIECIALPTLLAGAELRLIDPLSAEPGRIAAEIRSARTTFLSALPQFWASLVDVGADAGALATLRLPLCGSAALDPEVARAFADRFGSRIGQGYGLTEVGVICLNRHEHGPVRYDSVGPVLSGIEWRIHDPDASGVGELWVRSAGIAEGSERLRDGWLGTRDFVRADPDGYLFHRGRSSSFINVNGSKADPHEIERVIEALPWVRECAVGGTDEAGGGQRIVAYVVCDEDAPVEVPREAVRLCVAESLSLFKVPAEVILLEELPRNSLGKVLYAQLPAVPVRERPTRTGSASPRSENERAVAKIWCELLGLSSVGTDESFVDLGGTSLLLAELHRRLRERFDCDLTLADLFRYPTVASLAGALNGDPARGIVEEARERGQRQREAMRENRRKPRP